jgi:hypothetical protein
MKCSLCKKIFLEKDIDESHDVPCYLFKGFNRKEKKAQADKYDRHYLCKQCHESYEENLRAGLILWADKFSKQFWGNKK